MKARGLMKRDIDYVVKDGQVIIVDEFTGRLMYGRRRYNEGLHQAIEAKEGVKVASENKTLATITFQNFFRLYAKLSGMTGTALTEEEEFSGIYDLDVVEIPTTKPVIRIDNPDIVYKTEPGKFRAVIRKIKECHEKGQPVLVGTISIEKSELLSQLLKREGIPHNVLNAKHHEKEAEIVAQAGHLGAVTIATNMAGRGTDIMLGGNAEFMAKSDLRRQGLSDELIAESIPSPRRTTPRSSPPARPITRPTSATRPRSTARPISSGRPEDSTSSAPSGTSPAASTTSSAAAQAVRATRPDAVLPLDAGRRHAPVRL